MNSWLFEQSVCDIIKIITANIIIKILFSSISKVFSSIQKCRFQKYANIMVMAVCMYVSYSYILRIVITYQQRGYCEELIVILCISIRYIHITVIHICLCTPCQLMLALVVLLLSRNQHRNKSIFEIGRSKVDRVVSTMQLKIF